MPREKSLPAAPLSVMQVLLSPAAVPALLSDKSVHLQHIDLHECCQLRKVHYKCSEPESDSHLNSSKHGHSHPHESARSDHGQHDQNPHYEHLILYVYQQFHYVHLNLCVYLFLRYEHCLPHVHLRFHSNAHLNLHPYQNWSHWNQIPQFPRQIQADQYHHTPEQFSNPDKILLHRIKKIQYRHRLR